MPKRKTAEIPAPPEPTPAGLLCTDGSKTIERIVLRIEDGSLDKNAQGRLGTNPTLLIAATKIGQCLADERPKPCLVTAIGAVPGGLEQDLHWSSGPQHEMMTSRTVVEHLLATLRDDCRRLSENAKLSRPEPIERLKIPTLRFRLLEALAAIRSNGAVAVLRCERSGKVFSLPLPDQRDLDAIPKPHRSASIVSGRVTGVGIDDRIEVNRGGLVPAIGLTLEVALDAMRNGRNVTARKVELDGAMVLTNIEFMPIDGNLGLK